MSKFYDTRHAKANNPRACQRNGAMQKLKTMSRLFPGLWVCVFVGAISAQTMAPTPSPEPNFSTEAKIDVLTKKIEEQNTKIDLLSQQILKLQQQLSANGSNTTSRPGVMVGEGAPSPTASTIITSTSSPAPSAPAGGTSHVVTRGETLTSIAKTYNVSITELQKYNHIENPLKLQAGQTLMIPPSPAPSPSTSGE
jgi:LysM repeat protein